MDHNACFIVLRAFIFLSVHTVDCIEKSGLHIFIDEVGNNWKTFDSATVVLGLQVTAWLAGNVVFFSHFKSSIHQVVTALCRDVQTGDLPDTSVITALYETLATLVRQKESLQWIIFDHHIAGMTCYFEGKKQFSTCTLDLLF